MLIEVIITFNDDGNINAFIVVLVGLYNCKSLIEIQGCYGLAANEYFLL